VASVRNHIIIHQVHLKLTYYHNTSRLLCTCTHTELLLIHTMNFSIPCVSASCSHVTTQQEAFKQTAWSLTLFYSYYCSLMLVLLCCWSCAYCEHMLWTTKKHLFTTSYNAYATQIHLGVALWSLRDDCSIGRYQ
jgi:hypothetical protein